ncbi:hypothetical protein D9758_009272 [Tetrapyrgos nigripes]|uniref:Peroxin/Ferlin domain-containing protein n=1 Tax=Tetrapyrgos nigripes TaxID=182062 RepID=A0A8H5FXC2_9AGAR|nr:hypothetical protein D9758_009272 [Tetrapyrgos nigripes]
MLGGSDVGGGTGTGRSGVNDQGEDKGWMCGGDEDGFIYTNDAWQNPSPTPYPGSVTRRRWVRRIWWDEREGGSDG